MPGASTRTSIRSPTMRGAPFGCQCVLELGALAQALQGELGGNGAGQPGGVGARLRGEGEEAGPVQAGLGQELEQEVVVLLGLTRVSRG